LVVSVGKPVPFDRLTCIQAWLVFFSQMFGR
jgi:hypothetical protein